VAAAYFALFFGSRLDDAPVLTADGGVGVRYHRRVRVQSCVVALLAGCGARAEPTAAGTVRLETIARDLVQPVSLAFTPEGDLFVSEKQTGRVRLIRRATSASPAAAETAAMIGRVDPRSERGLLGLATHPRWTEGQRLLYAYYTTAPEPAVQRVVTLEFDEKLKARGAPRTILDGLPATPSP
jgi:glucose/arabinose dehydrogenase